MIKLIRCNYKLIHRLSTKSINPNVINDYDIKLLNDEIECLLGSFDSNKFDSIDSNSHSVDNLVNNSLKNQFDRTDFSYDNNKAMISSDSIETNDFTISLSNDSNNMETIVFTSNKTSNSVLTTIKLDINMNNIKYKMFNEDDIEDLLVKLNEINEYKSIIFDLRSINKPISLSMTSLLNLCVNKVKILVLLSDSKYLSTGLSKDVMILIGLTNRNVDMLTILTAIS